LALGFGAGGLFGGLAFGLGARGLFGGGNPFVVNASGVFAGLLLGLARRCVHDFLIFGRELRLLICGTAAPEEAQQEKRHDCSRDDQQQALIHGH
ncbi:MAG: hypothetical protein KDI53_11190, partial [Candidatus Accumulibacter sp.]|nr:hypothetical protein [Accumulibacter sp.]